MLHNYNNVEQVALLRVVSRPPGCTFFTPMTVEAGVGGIGTFWNLLMIQFSSASMKMNRGPVMVDEFVNWCNEAFLRLKCHKDQRYGYWFLKDRPQPQTKELALDL